MNETTDIDLQLEEDDPLEFEIAEEDETDFANDEYIPTHLRQDYDYNHLENKPTINGVELSGDTTSEALKIVYRGTTEFWNGQPSLVSKPGALYIYTDYQTVDNGDGTFTIYPGIKIGDGTSYVVDMPFASSDNPEVAAHIEDGTRHVTAEEREFWNAKWAGYVSDDNPEVLVFTTKNIQQIYF